MNGSKSGGIVRVSKYRGSYLKGVLKSKLVKSNKKIQVLVYGLIQDKRVLTSKLRKAWIKHEIKWV